jgi:hypothetical protein
MTLNEMLKERDAAFILKRSKLKISIVLSNVRIPAPTRDQDTTCGSRARFLKRCEPVKFKQFNEMFDK